MTQIKVSDEQIEAFDLVRKDANKTRQDVQRNSIQELDSFVIALQTGTLPQ